MLDSQKEMNEFVDETVQMCGDTLRSNGLIQFATVRVPNSKKARAGAWVVTVAYGMTNKGLVKGTSIKMPMDPEHGPYGRAVAARALVNQVQVKDLLTIQPASQKDLRKDVMEQLFSEIPANHAALALAVARNATKRTFGLFDQPK